MDMTVKTVYIYGLYDPDSGELRYIGKTTNPHRRWLNHLCEKSRCRRTYWIASLQRRGKQPVMDVFEEICGGWPWQESERYWIAYALSQGARLVNMTSGGDGVPDWAAKPKKYYGSDHWTHKKPELLAWGDKNGSRRHPDAIWRGNQCPSSKLTEEQVIEIRERFAGGAHPKQIAMDFGVSRENVISIINRKSWRHV